jgi:hypothetical protein
MPSIGKQSLRLVVFLSAAGLIQVARAADAPADPCSLLTPAAVSTALGDTFGAPQKSIAPRPFANTVQGTDCHYATANGRHELLFRIYFDRSAAEATDLHARLKMFFGSGATEAAVGDEAYFDKNHSLHVRKGNVRFFLSDGNDQKKLTALGNVVAGRL